MATHPNDHTYLVDWTDLKGRNRETYIRAFDGIAARAVVTQNPDVQRIISVTRMPMPGDTD